MCSMVMIFSSFQRIKLHKSLNCDYLSVMIPNEATCKNLPLMIFLIFLIRDVTLSLHISIKNKQKTQKNNNNNNNTNRQILPFNTFKMQKKSLKILYIIYKVILKDINGHKHTRSHIYTNMLRLCNFQMCNSPCFE